MITRAITNAIQTAFSRKWDTLYWCVDVHGTIIVPNWNKDQLPLDCYPLSLTALKKIKSFSKFRNVLILSTSSHPKEIGDYMQFFLEHGVEFDYINSNPEVATNKGDFGYYEDKYYFNIMLEDKAGFDPYSDWHAIITLLNELENELS